METFITGGAGFLGRALLRSDWLKEKHVTVYSRDEHKQWRLKDEFPHHRFILGDVRDAERTAMAMSGAKLIIHAAAQKFVPEGETDAIEFVHTNINGTLNVGYAAGISRAKIAVLISTDKSVEPVNNYGATKMIAERGWLELGTHFKSTSYIVVRFGNVLGSTGSVVELFRKKIADDEQVSVTDYNATRFWMTPSDAVEAIASATLMAANRCIFVPNIRAASMRTLLQAMHIDCRQCTGLRPGEKMHERLIAAHENDRTVVTQRGECVIGATHRPVLEGVGLGMDYTSDTVEQLTSIELRSMLAQVRYD